MLRRLVAIALLAAATGLPSLAQQPAPQLIAQHPLMQIPGSSWWLAAAPGFAPSQTPTPALRHANGAALTLVEFQARGLSRDSFGAVGAVTAPGTLDEGRLEAVEAVTVGGRPAFLARARQPNRRAVAHNLFMEGERVSIGVTLTVPDAATELDQAAIRAMLLSLTPTPSPAPPQAQSQQLLRFPGSGWSISPPPGFALAAGPPAVFRHPGGAFIVLIESPRRRVDDQPLGSVGEIANAGGPNEGRIEAVEPLSVAGRPAALMRLRMTRRGMVVHSLALEGEGGNASVSIAVPDAAAPLDPATIRAALLSVAETRRSPAERLSDLPFRVGELAGMRVVNIVANSVVILTDGPGDLMDEAIDQPFVMLSLLPLQPRERFDPGRDVGQVAALIRERYPGAAILSQKVEPTAAGPVAAVVFTRTPPGKAKAVAGVAWVRVKDGAAQFMIGQFPPERSDLPARFIRIRDGVTGK